MINSITNFCPEFVEEVVFGLFDHSFDDPHQILTLLVGGRSASALQQIHKWVRANFRSNRTLSGLVNGEWCSVFRAADLAAAIGVSVGNASSLLYRLVKKGFLIQESDTSEYRQTHNYRGLAYRINYPAVVQLVLDEMDRLMKPLWKGILRTYKAIEAFLAGTFESFRKPRPQQDEPSPDMKPEDFERLFTPQKPVRGAKTSGQAATIRSRQETFRQHGLEAAIGDHQAGCSAELIEGLHKHLVATDINYSFNPGAAMDAGRVETWISRKHWRIVNGTEEERNEAIRIIKKCLELGKPEAPVVVAAPIDLEAEREAQEASRKAIEIEKLASRVWTRHDLLDEAFGFDYFIPTLPANAQYSLGEIFLAYDEGTPLTYIDPLGRQRPILPHTRIDYTPIEMD